MSRASFAARPVGVPLEEHERLKRELQAAHERILHLEHDYECLQQALDGAVAARKEAESWARMIENLMDMVVIRRRQREQIIVHRIRRLERRRGTWKRRRQSR